MSTSQMPTRRRSARLAEEDDDENGPPMKKTKLDEGSSAPTKSTNGRKKGAAPKKTKAAYDEDVDGFNFSRAKPKKATSSAVNKASPQSITTAPTEVEVQAKAQKEAPPPNSRRKKDSLEAKSGEQIKKRRSARLSAESQRDDSGPAETQHQTAEASKSTHERSKVPQDGELKVEKKRRTTKIALPFADTPVINRNREMRQSSGQGLRRSSGSMRGRRASSLIESGTSNAVPHGEVETANFYKHISSDLLETRRMKQLLTWCATRALPERSTSASEDMNATLAARHIEEELLKDFSNKSEMSDWFDRVDTSPTVLVKKPNPRNQQNAAKLQELRKERERLEKEKASWNSVLSSFTSSLQSNQSHSDLSNPRKVDSSALIDHEQQQILQSLNSQPDTIQSAQSRLKNATESLEFKVDTLGDGAHRLERFRETLDTVVDHVQRNAAEALERREDDALKKSGMDNVGVRDVLKALSRANQQ